MEIRLLGPLEVLDDRGGPIAVPGAKLRALLATLALRTGQVVSSDRLIEELWGSEVKSTAANSLQQLVSKLRRVLPCDAVVTRSPGYVLDLPVDSVDIEHFDRLALMGRKALACGDFVPASEALREALSLWRGPALSEFSYEEFAQPSLVRLTEERASVFEDRIDADLASGQHAELVAELEAAVSVEPLRERMRAQLMLALYRAGRQADALRQFQEARRVLGDELGLEPGPELRRLEAAILTQESGLDAPSIRMAAPTTSTRGATNLRPPPTATLGREDELASLVSLTSNHRLVTVVGPGGVGKTRLAIETGLRVKDNFRDGAWVVELGQVRDPEHVVTAIAATLGIADLDARDRAAGTPLVHLTNVLADRDLFLIFDNCEHLIDEVARVAEDVIACCRRVQLLATSREGLRLPGEFVWPVPPLSTDDAAELFTARASEVSPNFGGTEQNREIVREICVRLDGLPLAIELAAARARAFPPAQIAARLSDRFGLLSHGTRTAASRQQTLRAVVDWSYDLLFDDERNLFNRLSVFVDGCDLEAVEAVCADEMLPATDIADLLARLVEKSLVVADGQDGAARFSMLQTLSEYGRERLATGDELNAILGRHANWYRRLADRGFSVVFGAGQRLWLRQVSAELGNLGLAVDTAIEQRDAELAQAIASGLGAYWWMRGRPDFGLRWLETALSCAEKVKPATVATRSWALVLAAFLAFLAGRPVLSTAPIEEALEGFERSSDLAGLAYAKIIAVQVFAAIGAGHRVPDLLAQARDHFLEISSQNSEYEAPAAFCDALLAQTTGDERTAIRSMRAYLDHPAATSDSGRILILGRLADIYESRGQYQEAADALDEARRLSLERGTFAFGTPNTARLADLAMLTGDVELSEVLRTEMVDAAIRSGWTAVPANTLAGIAARRLQAGNLDAAAASAAAALVLYRGSDNVAGGALTLIILGWTAERRGDPNGAESYFARAFVDAHRARDSRLSREATEGMAAVALLRGDAARAARMLGAASRLFDTSPDTGPDATTLTGMNFLSGGSDPSAVERIALAACEQIGSVTFAEAYAAGGPADLADIEQITGTINASRQEHGPAHSQQNSRRLAPPRPGRRAP